MAEDNLKDFTINWFVLGLLLFSLITFATTFMYNNNPNGLGSDASSVFSSTNANLSTSLQQIDGSADKILNITSTTNPEASQLGSRDSVSTAYKAKDSTDGFFNSMQKFFAWVLVGETGQMLLAVFSGIFGFLAFYYIVKFIRNGI